MECQARVEGEIGDGRRQWWQQIGEIRLLAAWDRIARLLQCRLRSPDRIARSEQQTETLSQIARSPFRVIAVNAPPDRTFCKEERLSTVWLIDFQTQRMWSAMSVCVQSIVNCKFQTEKNEWERTWRVSGSSEIGFKMCEENKRKKKKRRLYNIKLNHHKHMKLNRKIEIPFSSSNMWADQLACRREKKINVQTPRGNLEVTIRTQFEEYIFFLFYYLPKKKLNLNGNI